MPRIDRGSLILDIASILKVDNDIREKLIDYAVNMNAIMVTQPSIVTIWVEGKAVRISLGIGSLIFQSGIREELEKFNVKVFELSRPEWVDGCVLKKEDKNIKKIYYLNRIKLNREEEIIRGRIIPADLQNTAILFIAGAEAEAYKPSSDLIGKPPLALIEDIPVIVLEEDEITSFIRGGEARTRLEYILPLLSYC
jgi:hypothetical protein